jgi:autotransporter-associated beta strand protein
MNSGELSLARGGETASLTIKNGTANIGTTSLRNLDIASDSRAKNHGTVEVLGGTLNVGSASYASPIRFMPEGSWPDESGTLSIEGGTVNAQAITFGAAAGSYSGLSTNRLSLTGGSLYLGAGGIVESNAHPVDIVTFSGGVVGALANWASAMTIDLGSSGGPVTFQAADAGNVARNITLSGSLTNAQGFIKTGGGTLILAGANTYSGVTTISGGTLLVNGSLGRGPVLVANNATLGGNGRIGGPVTVQGGTLALGAAVGTLILNNSLALSSASTTVMKLSKNGATLSSDSIRGVSTLTYGGTLKVSATGAALAAGDTFQLFQAAAYIGAFGSVKLPALGGNLSWDTSELVGSGTIRVTASSGAAAVASGPTPKAGNGNNAQEPPPATAKVPPANAAQNSSDNKAGALAWAIAGALAVLGGLVVWLVVVLRRGGRPRKPGTAQTTQAVQGAGSFAQANSPYGAGGGQSHAGAFSGGTAQSQQSGVLRQSGRSKPAAQGAGAAGAEANYSDDGFGLSRDAGQSHAQEGFRGELREVGLQDLIQLECLNGKSSTLEVSNKELRGRIFIQGGEIVHAIAGGLSGREALNRLLSLPGGTFSLKAFERPAERTIHGQWVELLMEAAYLRDKEASEQKNISFTPSQGGPEDILAMATLLRDHPQVKEVLVCSNEGKPLHNSRCADPVQRGEVCANLMQTTKAISELLPVGEFKQLEILNKQTRTILMAEQGCNLLVGMSRDGANTPL